MALSCRFFRALLLALLLPLPGSGISGQQSGTSSPPSGFARPLSMQTVVVEMSFSTNQGNTQSQTVEAVVPRFDPANGDLRAVKIRVDLDYSGQLEVESGGTNAVQGNWGLSGTGIGPRTTGLHPYPGYPGTVFENVGGTHLFGPRDGSSCNGGGADWALFSASGSPSAQSWNTDPAILQAWRGPPLAMSFTLQLRSALNPFPWNGCQHTDQTLTGRWTITYYYR